MTARVLDGTKISNQVFAELKDEIARPPLSPVLSLS